jgi:hypothetical protein
MPSFCVKENSSEWTPNDLACARPDLYGSRRSESGGSTKDSVNSASTRYFIDVGCWQGGETGRPKTTYAVISGHDALLCDWLGSHYFGKTSYDCPRGQPGQKLDDFIQACKKMGRGGAIGWAKAEHDSPFTDPGELLIVVPDLHLHLLKTEKVDRFVYRPDPDKIIVKTGRTLYGHGYAVEETEERYKSEITSLDGEMGRFLQLAKNKGAKIIHIGDMYEVWESEMVLRTIYRALLDHVHDWFHDKYNIYSPSPGLVRPEFEKSFPDSAVKQMILSGKVIPTEPGEGLGQYISKWSAIKWLPHIENQAIDFTFTEMICRAIERNYPGVFGTKFEARIWGNHDNSLKNNYWNANFVTAGWLQGLWTEHNCDMYQKLKAETKNWDHGQQKEYYHPTNDDRRVWIEHGHYYDWHNHDHGWPEDEHGFDVVFRGPVGKRTGGYIDWKLDNSRGTTDWMLSKADWLTEFERYEMRLPELRRADAICGHAIPEDKYRGADVDPLPGKPMDKRPQIVIMGHTHEPEIIECPATTPFREVSAEMRQRFISFISGKYYLDPKWQSGGKNQFEQDFQKEVQKYRRRAYEF